MGDAPEAVEDAPGSVYPWGTVRKPRPGDEFELVPEGVDAKGELAGYVDGYRVRVRRGEPGARLAVRVRKRRRNDLWADVTAVLERGPGAADPRCPHFGTCGGCRYQEMRYDVQLEVLHAALLRLLEPLPLDGVAVAPVRPSPRVWGYRNKMDFTFSNRRWVVESEPQGVASDFALGLHLSGRHQKVLAIESCDIAFEGVNGLLASARELALAQGLTPRDQKTHTGLLRHLVLRTGEASGDVMVHLVTASEDQGRPAADWVGPFAAELRARHPEVSTIVHTTTDRMSAVAQGDVERTLLGPGILRERLGDLDFEVSAASFFQTNTSQAAELSTFVREAVRATPEVALGRAPRSAFDIYCGGGMFALGLARDGLQVVGFELVESAVRDAERNAALNGIGGLRFVAGDVAKLINVAALAERGMEPPDVVVIDPPRVGVHRDALAALAALAPARIVYVSCNPKSAVSDLATLCAEGYGLSVVQPFDMFPHTPHLECVFVLDRRPSAAGTEAPAESSADAR